MILQTQRIDSRDIEKIDDSINKMNTEYKLVRWYAHDKKVRHVDIKKLDDGEFVIDIIYSEK